MPAPGLAFGHHHRVVVVIEAARLALALLGLAWRAEVVAGTAFRCWTRFWHVGDAASQKGGASSKDGEFLHGRCVGRVDAIWNSPAFQTRSSSHVELK